ncbi:MAG TPA: helix-turn-helix domain-containing protein [Candidatus Dormibacteraeota bacterium]|nr:helix-turn-helix domain-containing protein [Candidatus Dormibacteraeota bacterium]
MAVHVWPVELDPDFPLAVLEYTTQAATDRMHWHEYLEIALVLDGHGTFRFGRRELPAEPGDIFFIDDSHPHVAVAEPGTECRLLLALFRPELIASAGCRQLDLGYLAPFSVGEEPERARICGGSALGVEVASALQELYALWRRPEPEARYLADATLRRALGLVNRGRATGSASSGCGSDRSEQIRPVLAYVEGHCQESIRLEDVASVVHVSASRVRHLFKDVTGVSFKEYVTHVRVAESKRLLLGTDLSVAEVARQVSYTNLHQFYKVFQRSCSMSPAEYRRYYTPASPSAGVAVGGGVAVRGPARVRGGDVVGDGVVTAARMAG